MLSTGDMAGAVALVTGGSSGIGKATALAFAAAGARVAIASRGREAGEAAAAAINDQGGEAIWIPADASQASHAEAMVQAVLEAYGRLDCAFNNGGSGGEGGWTAELAEEDWQKTIDGFLKSVWLSIKYEIPVMLEGGGGAIVNNSSVDGERAFRWDPAYSAAKHGVLGLTKSAAVQYAPQGIRINAVSPVWIRTPPIESILQRDPDAETAMRMRQPIGRLGRAEEVARAVVWLCSENASLIVGTALAVDGGYLAV